MSAALSHLFLLRLLLAPGNSAGAPAGRAPDSLPDFTGRWELIFQETSAPRRRGNVGAIEDPLIISREGTLLRIASASLGDTGPLVYDVSGAPARRAGRLGEELETTTRIHGRSLVTRGRREFREGGAVVTFDFEETRVLSRDGREMTVTLRIKLIPADLKRVSRWRRLP